MITTTFYFHLFLFKQIYKKSFATARQNPLTNNLSNILNYLYVNAINNEYLSNNATQTAMEKLIFDNYKLLTYNSKAYSLGAIDTSFLNNKLNKFILDNNDLLINRVNDLKLHYNTEDLNKDDRILGEVINNLDVDFILNLCLLHFIIICCSQNTEDEDKFIAVNVAIRIGKKCITKYLYSIKCKDTNDKDKKYSIWYDQYSKLNNDFINYLEDDRIIAKLGFLLLQVLENSNMIFKDIFVKSKTEKFYIYKVDNNLLQTRKIPVIDLPLKLPMIVEPKDYDDQNLGGYLLNDVYYQDPLIVHKKTTKDKSLITKDNIIYNMINKVAKVPYKINTKLLDFILFNRNKLLIDNNQIAELEETIDYKNKRHLNKLKSLKSKFNLQQAILGLADFYRNFSMIYFPLRLDSRGRVYCNNTYLHYQSTELAKSLLLFANPSVISKDNLNEVRYLQYYGVNCFGKDKISPNSKIRWVNDNIDNILNYENGILLEKAKDKFLFLAFCIEYKRYHEFIQDENSLTFNTYLPIQLDATCNGFQHLALLSNEDTLFKELNLVTDKDRANDFYSFLILKLENTFDSDLSNENYLRLKNFVLERSYIKKAIMTIPYNVSQLNMIKYITDNLYRIEDTKDGIVWYSKSSKGNKPLINNKDIVVLARSIQYIVNNDFKKLKKLMKYLKNVATVLTLLGIPIIWSLPTGLTVKQSYLETRSTSINPFLYSKTKINIQVVNKNKYDKNKQIRALMPNLIHSLDASTLSLLYNKMDNIYNNPQFLCIHDCFGTTFDKVDTLKTMLTSVYTELYSDDPYLIEFDEYIIKYIEKQTGKLIDKNKRIVEIIVKNEIKQFELHDIKWVTNKNNISKNKIDKINSQYILI